MMDESERVEMRCDPELIDQRPAPSIWPALVILFASPVVALVWIGISRGWFA